MEEVEAKMAGGNHSSASQIFTANLLLDIYAHLKHNGPGEFDLHKLPYLLGWSYYSSPSWLLAITFTAERSSGNHLDGSLPPFAMRASHSTLQFFITGLQGCGKVSLLPY
jgi:hypothetical protein